MNKKPRSLIRIIIPVVLTLVTIALIVWPMLAGGQYVVLDPKGPIGASQRDLIVISTILCAVIIVPVLILSAVIVSCYRRNRTTKLHMNLTGLIAPRRRLLVDGSNYYYWNTCNCNDSLHV